MIHLTRISTGRSFAGSRVAIIYAPPEAPPGSMESLTRFLDEQGIRVLPGYEGKDRQHVLRLSGFDNDEQLHTMLTSGFADWQKTHPDSASIRVSPDLQFEKLQLSTSQETGGIAQYLKQNSDKLSGFSYLASNVALLMSALNDRAENKPHTFKTFAAINYILSSTILLMFSQGESKQRSMHDILSDIEPKLQKMSGANLGKMPAELQKETFRTFPEKIIQFFQRYPWEASALVSTVASGIFTYQSLKGPKKDWGEAVFGIATLTALAINAFVPQKGGRSLIDIGKYFPGMRDKSFAQAMESVKENMPILAPAADAAAQVSDWIHERPLQVAARIQQAGVIGHFVSVGLSDRKEHDKSALFVAPTTLVGTYFQHKSNKHRGMSLDDVVTESIELLEQEHRERPDESREVVMAKVKTLAHELSEQPEIVHRKERIEKGIMARVKQSPLRAILHKELSKPDMYLKSEAEILKSSPFMHPSVVRTLNDPSLAHAR